MKFLGKAIISATILLFGLGIGSTAPTTPNSKSVREQQRDEVQAASALTKLGVPLQRDTQGVVRWIEAAKGEFIDEAMQYLPRLSRLEWLEIGGGGVSAAGMNQLEGCSSLRRLYIHDVNLRGDELTWLSHLQNLEALSLQRTGITGKALTNLSASDTLTVLNLSGNEITNDDMDTIAQIKGLEVLALADTKITGSGIAKLEGMPRLNELNLMRCSIFDSDLEYFLSMPNLRIVYAEGCDLSEIGVQVVIARFPMLAIFR